MVVTQSNIILSFLVVMIPMESLIDTFLKLQARLPAKLTLELAAVYNITNVVALTVSNMDDNIHVFTFITSQ